MESEINLVLSDYIDKLFTLLILRIHKLFYLRQIEYLENMLHIYHDESDYLKISSTH